MKKISLYLIIKRNFFKRPVRNCILLICVAAVVGMQISAALIERSSQKGLELGLKKLGADLIAVPRGLKGKLVRSYMAGKPSQFYMDHSVKSRIANLDYVESVSAQLYIQSLSGASCCSAWNVFLIGFEPESDFTVTPWLKEQKREKLSDNEIITGAAISAEPGTSFKFFGQEFKVAGVLSPGNMGLDTSVFIPMAAAYKMARESGEKAEKKLDIDNDMISAVLIKLKDHKKGGLPGWKAAYMIEREMPEVSIIQPSDMTLKAQKNMLGILSSLRSASYAIWPVTALLIGLVFAMAANERKAEIGLFRAIGATRGFIFRMIIIESLFIAGLGTVIGLTFSVGIVTGFSKLIAFKLEMPFYLPGISELVSMVTIAVILALATGGLSAAIPAFRASVMEPYEAIRAGNQ